MKASFLDLRKKSKEIIGALNRNEQVTVLYRGKPAAIMQPIHNGSDVFDDQTKKTTGRAENHAAFGLWAKRGDLKDVAAHVRNIRKGRLNAL